MGKHGFSNNVRLEGDVAFIELNDRKGVAVCEVMIDAADLPMIAGLGKRWSRGFYGSRRLPYAFSNVNGGLVLLHRLLTDAPKGTVVDHINNDSLDNRRSNLRVTDPVQNGRNRAGAARNSRSGVRNVRWDERFRKPYIITLRSRGNIVFYQAVKTLNIARITAEMARVELWGVEAA